MKKSVIKNIILCAIFVLSMLGVLYYANKKEGYHVDELYSYGLANSEYLPFMHFGEIEYGVKDWMIQYGAGENLADLGRNLINDFKIIKAANWHWRDTALYHDYLRAQANSADTMTTTWVSGQEYRDYLTATENSRFNYASVYYNQRGDVHPPLFYLILHTLCSFFPGVYSKWFGLVMNAFLMLMALITLWRLTKKYLGGDEAALLCVAVYGLSVGFVSTAVFIRMYALLTWMILLCLEAHLDLLQSDFVMTGKRARHLILVILLGYLTHYYFVLYVLVLAAVSVVCMAVRRKWKCVLQYAITTGLTGLIGIVIWPFSIKHVLWGYRGQESIQALKSGLVSPDRWKIMWIFLRGDVLGGQTWLLLLLLTFLLGSLAWLGITRRKDSSPKAALSSLKVLPWAKAGMLVVPALIYWCVVAQSVPFFDRRYILCLYPLLVIFLTAGMLWPIRRMKLSGKGWIPAVILGCALILCNNFVRMKPDFLFPGGQETTKIPQNTVCVYVLPDAWWNESATETNLWAKCEKIAVICVSQLEILRDTYQYKDGDTVLVAVQTNLDAEEVLENVKNVLGVEKLREKERKTDSGSVKIYLSALE